MSIEEKQVNYNKLLFEVKANKKPKIKSLKNEVLHEEL